MLHRSLKPFLYALAGFALLVSSMAPQLSLTASLSRPPRAQASSAPILGLSTSLGVPASPDIDVSDLVSSVLAGVATPATVVLEGVYRIDHTVLIENKADLVITCRTQPCGFIRFVQTPTPANWPRRGRPYLPYLIVRNGTRVALERFTITGPLQTQIYTASTEFAAGVIVSGGSDIVLRNLTISGVHGDFVALNDWVQQVPRNVLIEDMVGDLNGRQSAGVAAGDGVVFRRVRFTRSARSGIDLEPATLLGVKNVTIEDSYVGAYRNFGLNPHPNVHNVTVRRTTFIGGRGLMKAGPPLTYVGGNNQGFVMEDVSYDWAGIDRRASLGIQRTDGLRILRLTVRIWGQGSILGTGVVQESSFISDRVPPPNPVVCLGAGVLDINNVGTGSGPACGGS